MKNLLLLSCMAAAALGLFTPSQVRAQDWPQWRGPNRDGKAAGFSEPNSWPQKLTPKWKVAVGIGDSTPALVGGRLYAFGRQDTNEVVTCLDGANGNTLWENKYPADHVVTGPPARHPGTRSSPAVFDGRVYTLGVGGILSCLDAKTGAVLWRKQSTNDYQGTAYNFDSSMSPILVEGVCIVQIGGKGQGAVMAFDQTKGALKWKCAGEAPASSSPALLNVQGKKQIVTLTAKSVVGVSCADGKLLWQIPFEATQGNNTTPIIDGQTVIYTGQGKGTFAIKVEFLAEGCTVIPIWTNTSAAPRFTTPVLKQGLLFGYNNKFYCQKAATGELLWADSSSRGNSAAIVDAGAVLLATTVNSELVAFKASDKEYAELAHYKVADSEVWAHPVVSGNRVYIRDRENVALFVLE